MHFPFMQVWVREKLKVYVNHEAKKSVNSFLIGGKDACTLIAQGIEPEWKKELDLTESG